MTARVSMILVFSALVALQDVSGAAAQTPRRGGVLLSVIGADAPSLDPHQEQTFATMQPVAPLYSTLLQIDPYNYPNVIGDLATDWKIAPDGLTYTFKIRQGVRFHDGSPLTSADIKASYDKILFPPDGVRSIRKHHYSAVASVEAPDAEHRGLQAEVPLGLAPGEPRVAVERDLSRRSISTRIRTTSRPTSSARAPSSSRATRAARPSRASATPTTSSRTGPT